MKYLIPIMVFVGLVFLAGCQVQTETKYQCANGEVVDSLDLCSSITCPELDCSECPKQTETETKEVIKYQCYNGDIKDKISECSYVEEDIETQEIKDETFSISSFVITSNNIIEIEITSELTPNSPLNMFTHPPNPTNKNLYDDSQLIQIGLDGMGNKYSKNVSDWISKYESLNIYGFGIVLCDKEVCNYEEIEYSKTIP
ncbi:hypothetical protein K9L97_03895 [Candidatus Woesearchaeota archaeon]|nr:hypothetical protein [Candidatus Woesearchaeota archaeon]